MKMNYFFAISSLIYLKQRHHLIQDQKNEAVLKYLATIEINDYDDSDQVPDAKMIATQTNLPRNKVYDILYQTYLRLIESLGEHPHQVAECIHAIYINTPLEFGRKSKPETEGDQSRFLLAEFKLPVTPRLGENIRIDFLDREIKYSYGVVTEIHHDIRPHQQRIVIYVNPIHNFYWQWEKLKEEQEDRQRWMNRLKEVKR